MVCAAKKLLETVIRRPGRRFTRNLSVTFCIVCIFVLYEWSPMKAWEDGAQVHAAAFAQQYGWLRTRSLRQYVSPERPTSLLSPARRCAAGPALLLTVLVVSAPANVAARRAIRRTWGGADRLPERARTFFLVGLPGDEEMQAAIDSESAEHGDVIQEPFVDHYRNLTVKSVYMLKWLASQCADAPFALKADDDMWVDMPALLRLLAACRRPGGACADDAALLAGLVYRAVAADRAPRSRWYLPPALWRGERLPDFVSGTAYVISRAAVAPLYARALDTPYINLEDVFMSGLVAPAAGVRLLHVAGFEKTRPLWAHACTCRGHVTVHGLAPHVLERLYATRHAACGRLWDVVNWVMIWVT